jgi:hypothetical protein
MTIAHGSEKTAWGLVTLAALLNISGYVWNLYDKVRLFDEVVHTYTLFALTLLVALLLFGIVLTGFGEHRGLLFLVIVCIGLAVGAVWEITEWAYDLVVPSDVIQGKQDTMTDLILDGAGAAIAGLVGLQMFRQGEQ